MSAWQRRDAEIDRLPGPKPGCLADDPKSQCSYLDFPGQLCGSCSHGIKPNFITLHRRPESVTADEVIKVLTTEIDELVAKGHMALLIDVRRLALAEIERIKGMIAS